MARWATDSWQVTEPSRHHMSSGWSEVRRSNWAFSATTIVEADIRTAPMAGLITIFAQASTPAASGIAMTL